MAKERRGKDSKQNAKYLSFGLASVFFIAAAFAARRYYAFFTLYEEKLYSVSAQTAPQQANQVQEVSEIYSNVLSRYEAIIKNSTRWVYTSLEAYKNQDSATMMVQEHGGMSIYPNWLGCKKGFFKLPKMDKCRPWLNCREIEKITVNRRINHGLGKEVFDATWNDLTVAYVRLRPERLHQEPIRGRVRAGIENLIRLQPSPYVTQVLGYCFEGLNSIMIAELAPYGDLKDFLTSIDYANLNPLGRLGVSIRLARVFSFMHNSPIGTRVNCDMTKVTRALSQFLVTEDFRIVANDLDDLPEVNKEEGLLANCTWGKLEDRDPLFQSPEERAILPALPAPFTEKADIWKIANMTQFIMYKSTNGVKERGVDQILEPLSEFLQQCQSENPEDRPDSKEVVSRLIEEYKKQQPLSNFNIYDS